MKDIVIIGAGPVGLACGIEAKRAGMDAVIVEKGAIVNSLMGYPLQMRFFSTPQKMEIGGYPFSTLRYKASRGEALEYYRLVAHQEKLDLRLYERVLEVEGSEGNFSVRTTKGGFTCRKLVVATGFFDHPKMLNVPGEDLSKVTHYFREAFPYSGTNVAVIGGRNSAAKAALECYRHGANVTMIHRGPIFPKTIKFWVRPNLLNRIKEGSITAHLQTTVRSIEPYHLQLEGPDGPFSIENDFVVAMTGYRPDFDFLEKIGIGFRDDPYRTLFHDPETFETNRPGIYVAGTVCGGMKTNRWFIENGRFHAMQIIQHITTGQVNNLELHNQHWETQE